MFRGLFPEHSLCSNVPEHKGAFRRTRRASERRRQQLDEELRAGIQRLPGVLERLPQVLGRRDVCRVLGYEPKRSSLSKALLELIADGGLALEESGGGEVPSRSRRL